MEQIQMKIDEQKLERINKGHNFYNLKQREKKYFIEVMLETKQNLQEEEESIRVKTDLPLGADWRNWRDYSVIEFIKTLNLFVKKPLVKIKLSNRKNTISSYELSNMKDDFRDKVLKFSNISISVGELAKKKLRYDFKEKVKELLKEQKETDKQIQKRVDRFFELREKVLLLKGLMEKDTSPYGYGYQEKRDDTIKLILTPLEYNKKLKEIEIEIKKIAKKLNIDEGDFDYQKIQKQVSFKEWLDMNKVELEDNFGDYDDGEYENFDDYAEQMFDESGGLIEENWGD